MKKIKHIFNRLLIGFTAALLLATTGVHAGQTTRVSVSSAGTQADCSYITEYGCSFTDAISADGRYVVFSSYAGGLVAGYGSLYVRDRVTGKTTRVNGVSNNVFESFDTSAISADGRYIVFSSLVNNLVPGDTNEAMDIFVRDRVTGTTSLVSVSSKGVQGNDYSFKPAVSADGRYVAFRSWADNLVADDTNGTTDVFVRDRMTGKTTRVNVSSTGLQGNGNDEDDYFNDFRSHIAISADGRYVAFSTNASNLVTGDTNGIEDVFVRDRMTGKTTLVSVSSTGVQGVSSGYFPEINADGRYVVFESDADNLVPRDTNGDPDVFARDRLLNTTSAADLQVTVTAKPVSVRKSQTASYKLTVKNNGPDSASNVALTDIVSNGTVLSITPSQGTCSKAAISVCRLGTLAAGATASVAVNIKADANPLTHKISVSASSKGNAPGNNAVNIYTTVTP